MWILSFYRAYFAVCAGAAEYFLLKKSLWLSAAAALVVRVLWFAVEQGIRRAIINRDFKRHVYEFKQQLGPYGIRMANKADNEWPIKKALPKFSLQTRQSLKKTSNSSR